MELQAGDQSSTGVTVILSPAAWNCGNWTHWVHTFQVGKLWTVTFPKYKLLHLNTVYKENYHPGSRPLFSVYF
jgi:hypothetical protein